MLRGKEILDALEREALAVFPGRTMYRTLVREGFTRPSCLVELGEQTMEDAARWTVERTVLAKLTIFEPVDEYHDTQVDVLVDKLSLAMAHFSAGCLHVGDRYLDIGKVKGERFYDYAELTFTLSWQDDRETGPVESALAQYYDLTIEVNKKEV